MDKDNLKSGCKVKYIFLNIPCLTLYLVVFTIFDLLKMAFDVFISSGH